ncbi:MAG: outer membrane beta-barrel protein, partial [Proteobacteria bacterium]|nr:outer membrane beta-barrel protein [Pseudomonadota bacterium]
DWHALVDGTIDASAATQVLLGGAALQEHEDRASPDAVEGLTPTLYHEYDAYAGVIHNMDVYSLRVGTAIQHLTFDNVQGANGEINNQDRNRTRYTFGFLLLDNERQSFRPYVEALGDIRQYDQQPDDFGYYRDSGGFRAGIGTRFSLLPTVTGELSVGVMARSYQDPRFQQIVTPAASAYLRWEPGDSTAVVLFLDRSIEETTLPGSPAYIYTVVGGRIEQQLAERWRGIVRAAYSASVFAQSPRIDSEGDMSAGLRYQLTPRLVLGVDYRYTERVSNDSIYNFTRNQIFFEITSAF